jgi:sRNA-binding protein
MTPNKKIEQKRGYQEASKQLDLLRAKWPKAFPSKAHEVRPLASGTVTKLADALGWSHPYARAVLTTWKMREAYCKAVLCYAQRINLDGSASGEEVDDGARARARERLDKIAARAAEKANKLRGLTENGAQDEMLEPSLADIQATAKIA